MLFSVPNTSAQGLFPLGFPEAYQDEAFPHQDGALHQHPVGGQEGELLSLRHVRETLEEQLPDNTETIIDELYALKQQLKETVPEQSERAEQLRRRLYELLNEEH